MTVKIGLVPLNYMNNHADERLLSVGHAVLTNWTIWQLMTRYYHCNDWISLSRQNWWVHRWIPGQS